MKKSNRIMALSVAAMMALTACGGGNAEATKAAETNSQQNQAAAGTAAASAAAETTAAEAESEAAAPAGDPVYVNENAKDMTGNVRFYTCFAGEVGTDALIAEFNEYYPNVNVEAVIYKNSPDGNIGLDTAMMAGEVDVALSFGVQNTAARWENSLLLDMTDRLAADNLDLVKEWGTDAYTYNDRVYCLPSGGLSCYVAINMDKWNEAGLGELPVSWTYDEYIEACRAMTKDDVYGGSDFNQTDYWTYSVRQSKGTNVFYNEEGLSDFDNPVWANALQRQVDAEAEGVWYPKVTMLANGEKTRELFLTGKIASTVESILTRYIKTIDHDFLIGYAPYPVANEGEVNYMGGAIPNSHIIISKNCQDEEAAYAFAKFAATYGNKYMYAAGHAGTWTGNDLSEILTVVFGSREEAEKYVDTEAFERCVIAIGEPAYSEDYISAYSEIQDLINEYTVYALNGEMTVEDVMAEMKKYADEAIKEKQ